MDRIAAPSIIKSITDSPDLVALRERRVKSVSIPMNHSIDVITKAVLGITPAGAGNNYYDAVNQRMPGVSNDARPPLRLLEALPKISCTSNTFEFVKLDGFTSAAAVQVEGAAKAEQALPTSLDLGRDRHSGRDPQGIEPGARPMSRSWRASSSRS